MEFMALIYGEESVEDDSAGTDREAIMAQYIAFSQAARAAGVVVTADELAPARNATTVRVRNGVTAVTDGPYAETKEVLGGYFLLDCATIEDAVAWAARIPGAAHGAVEVRPVHVDPEEV